MATISLEYFLNKRYVALKSVFIFNFYTLCDDLSIHSSDLTEEGLAIMKKCDDKWLKKIDKGGNSFDLKIFEKELQKMRYIPI